MTLDPGAGAEHGVGPTREEDLIHLRGRDLDVVVDLRHGSPVIAHWGAPVGDGDLDAIRAALERPLVHGSPDAVAPVAVVPEHGSGFAGRPGLLGHRPGGRHWAPRFSRASHVVGADHDRLMVVARDDVAELELVVTFALAEAFVVQAELANRSADARYELGGLTITLPLPEHAAELGSFTGRWTRELHPVRLAWPHGAHTAENRRGRTSHEHPPLVFAGTAGFGEWHGEVWGAHLAWSGNHLWLAERLADGRRYLQLGELLHPGELVLEPGEIYRTPEVVAVHAGSGLTEATKRFHRHLRARPTHPTAPRPVLVNTWEAVYFDHDFDTLRALADRAATAGIERFVLDDGWFGSRRDATAGLGDWVVSDDAHPLGLGPLIDHVTGLGMEFGIWVEPEMVNPDSDLFRAHPDWALATDGYEPVLARHQLVLDLTRPGAYDHVLGQLDALLGDHAISYVKWDMNRDHIAASRDRWRCRDPRPDAGPLSDARRTARPPPTRRDRVVRVWWRPHRSRDTSPRGAGVDQRLQRCPRTPDDPARRVDVDPARADGRPHRARAIAHDRSSS